ncbi:hypothetical protein CBL_06160 [Carabus blaptoides fortunei]
MGTYSARKRENKGRARQKSLIKSSHIPGTSCGICTCPMLWSRVRFARVPATNSLNHSSRRTHPAPRTESDSGKSSGGLITQNNCQALLDSCAPVAGAADPT